ncbi:DNA-3-methyladenine glycosylase I [Novosphingobium profundi]|uniref:DNA-3-methyladenine glycosylase I n=1 Tax=Novosphingobium profundi TaxID=1774954 RepID=UPI001BD99869|nr:DNA-3-methyladenine glycosylase I [Novosphingobium profundi]MBT0669632.1 DNA-3-methyladenine glycosylase I [Novosphingobium profundi]
MPTTAPGPDGLPRCQWATTVDAFIPYHDAEWGFPVADDTRLFEKLCLESFQSGLSWRTILAKRENFRAAFAGFDFTKVARFDAADVARLLGDTGIVRHRGKIEATIANGRCACELVETHASLAAYFWSFAPSPAEHEAHRGLSTSPASVALSKALRKRGWKFVGPTTVHAFLQAAGLINDHARECHAFASAQEARARFTPPRPPA